MLKPNRQHVVVTEEKAQNDAVRKSGTKQVESRNQKRFVVWARQIGLEIAHLNNGASSKTRRINLAALGCQRGAADLLIFDRLPAQPMAGGLALEFKSPEGRQSKDQKRWQKRIERLGWVYRVVRSDDEARGVCREMGLDPG